jgi:hypothetical protein
MRLIFTLFSLLLLGYSADAQKLTGIWRGYFSSTNGIYREGVKEEMYKFEVQIDQQSNNGIKGVTYSYKSTVFYGKAEIQGIFTAQTKSLIIRETKLVDLKVAGESEPCLMTCYLDYSKIGKMEFLQGTFISINAKDKGDCGSGKVYLERVATSDFKTEDFLLKKKEIDTTRKKAIAANTPKNNSNTPKPVTKQPLAVVPPPKANANIPKPATKQPAIVVPPGKNNTDKTTAAVKPATSNSNNKPPQKPPVKDDKSNLQPHINRVPEESVQSSKPDSASNTKTESSTRKILIPKVLTERENNLVITIPTDQENLQIDLYDNGTIDNDTISVYHNNVLVVNNGQLTYSPITIKIKCSKTESHHEIIVVAENLGDIPPNTALMVITAGGKSIMTGGKTRLEVFLDTNEQRNAKIIFDYKPKQ